MPSEVALAVTQVHRGPHPLQHRGALLLGPAHVDAVESPAEVRLGGEVVRGDVGEAVVEEEEQQVGTLDAAGPDHVHRFVAQPKQVLPGPDPLTEGLQDSCTGRR